MQNTKIQKFTQLKVWQNAHKLVVEIYKITKQFPDEEKYALGDQMRRCAVSITSNIAEGFGRQGFKEKIQFYYTSQGSNTELQNQLLIARDVNYINNSTFNKLADKSISVAKQLNALIRSIKSKHE